MLQPRPFPKPRFTRPDLVSTKIETSYDAVSKIKDIYANVLGNLKSSYSSVIDSINTEIAELEKITLTKASNTAETIIDGSDFSALDSTGLTNPSKLAKTLSDNISNRAAEKIVSDAISNETEYVTSVNSVLAKIKGLATKLQLENESEASTDELEKQLFIVNDLFSPKDHMIANLEAERNNAVEELNNLQAAYDELKKEFDNLKNNLLDSIDSSIASQKYIQKQQDYLGDIIDSIITTNLIDVNPIKKENL